LMPFVVYLAILTATLFSVVLEWDALVEHPPAARHAVQAVMPASPLPLQSTTVTPAPAARAQAPAEAPPPTRPAAAEVSAMHCNVDACAGAYRSFRASDCSWQPNEGPRRLCVR
jgi:hypothetical protein